MTDTMTARYTLEFTPEAVRVVESGQRAAAARTLGVAEQTLFNRVKPHRAGKLDGGRQIAAL